MEFLDLAKNRYTTRGFIDTPIRNLRLVHQPTYSICAPLDQLFLCPFIQTRKTAL